MRRLGGPARGLYNIYPEKVMAAAFAIHTSICKHRYGSLVRLMRGTLFHTIIVLHTWMCNSLVLVAVNPSIYMQSKYYSIPGSTFHASLLFLSATSYIFKLQIIMQSLGMQLEHTIAHKTLFCLPLTQRPVNQLLNGSVSVLNACEMVSSTSLH